MPVKQTTVIELQMNGEARELAVRPQETLLEVLRDRLGLTGTKEGCGTGECGSCTVLLDGDPILSCLTLAVDCEGKSVVTIEGLAPQGVLTPLQEAFVQAGAVQCGFCTPGMILSATALLREIPHPGLPEIEKALEGNLCRCTGYNKIVDAIRRAAAAPAAGQE
jgi:aerobic-type carbon monoxide dehydrogenase small subunit (CoxS/CutS family)